MSTRKTVADQLRQALRATGLSVYRLAKDSGVAQPVLHRFMSGERDLTLTTANTLAVFLGLEFRPAVKRRGRKP